MNEYVYSWVTLWHIWNQDNIVSQLWPESATAALNLVSLLLATTLLKKNNREKKGLKVLKTGHICLCLSKTAFCVCPVCSEYGHVATPSCKGSMKQIFILVFTSALVKLPKKNGGFEPKHEVRYQMEKINQKGCLHFAVYLKLTQLCKSTILQ